MIHTMVRYIPKDGGCIKRMDIPVVIKAMEDKSAATQLRALEFGPMIASMREKMAGLLCRPDAAHGLKKLLLTGLPAIVIILSCCTDQYSGNLLTVKRIAGGCPYQIALLTG